MEELGGGGVQVGEFPYMAVLGFQINGKIQYRCGGSLINRRYVLTAANCHSPRHKIAQVTKTFGSALACICLNSGLTKPNKIAV